MEATEAFIQEHLQDDVRKLALQASRYPQVDMPYVLNQVAGYQTALQKLPTYARIPGIRYPQHLSMEQCSSEQTACYKMQLVQQSAVPCGMLVDLTAGFGVDFSFMARLFDKAIAVERQPALCRLHAHNFPLLGLSHACSCEADGMAYLQEMEPVDWIFLDPARRDGHGGKVVRIADCEPDVSALEELLLRKARKVMVKLSPMLDISLALHTLRHVEAVHVVAVQNECKELLVILGHRELPVEQVPVTAVNLTPQGSSSFTFTFQEERQAQAVLASEVATYLYEPHAALAKSGAFQCLAVRMQLEKLHPNSHLYTSTQWVPAFPGRRFQVVGCAGWGKKEQKSLLQGVQQANLAVRNFPASVAELRKRLKLKEGGEEYLFATTLKSGNKVLIRCRKV